MKDELSDEQSHVLLKALDKAIEQGPWEKSSFLRMIGKSLRDLRDKLAKNLQPSESDKAKKISQLTNRMALHSGQQEIYISLYSSDGTNIKSWERIISNLPNQVLSRPIYASEEEIRAMIRTKENKNNEAYVAIYVNQSDVLSFAADKTPVDKFGVPLLALKGKSLHLENISRFVHVTGSYSYLYGRLSKEASNG